jgi:hypothetical protein
VIVFRLCLTGNHTDQQHDRLSGGVSEFFILPFSLANKSKIS